MKTLSYKLKCAAALLAIGAITSAMLLYQSKNQINDFEIISSNFCTQSKVAKLAYKQGLDYKLVVNYFEFPTVSVYGSPHEITDFKQAYHALPDKSEYITSYKDSILNHDCHLYDIKHHTDNINAKLLPYIPDDADYVSYDPNSDRAVYCYYLLGMTGGSKCYLIQIFEDKLIKDDISDLERVNLVKLNQLYSLRKDLDDFYHVRSWVLDWDTSPHKQYGFRFQTTYYGLRWGMANEY